MVLFFRRASCDVGPVVEAARFAVPLGAFCGAGVSADLAPPSIELVAGAVVAVVVEEAGIVDEAVVLAGAAPNMLLMGFLGASGAVVVLVVGAGDAGVAAPNRLLIGLAGSAGADVAAVVVGFKFPKSPLA
jgi:hypothetical protein